ncbi:MAG: MFS transporter [Janthinobacterium lividum]
MLMESVVPSIMPLRLKHLGASNTTTGLMLTSIPLLFGAIVNPIVSVKSDRHRGPWGRRIPFILYTLPFLVISLIGLGFAERLGSWAAVEFGVESPREVAIATIAIFILAFTFFNSFVTSVFWYLFNDVVPEPLLARFMSVFRLFSMGSQALYSFFVFQYAGAHSAEILAGAGLLYFFGFGLMCLNVKEGQYPPPSPYIGNERGPGSAVRTFVKECLSLPHYWFQFLSALFMSLSYANAIFAIFFYQSTGLDLQQIGIVQGSISLAAGALIPWSGWLADRFHPLRIVIAGYLVTILLAIPATFIWFFWHPVPKIAFLAWLVISIVFTAPAAALIGICDPPLLMRIFPRDRYGQFCSANALLRSVGGIIGGVLCGAFFDLLKAHVPPQRVYCYTAVWQLVFMIPSLFFLVKLYQSWKRYGGDASYVPPLPSHVSMQVNTGRDAEPGMIATQGTTDASDSFSLK